MSAYQQAYAAVCIPLPELGCSVCAYTWDKNQLAKFPSNPGEGMKEQRATHVV